MRRNLKRITREHQRVLQNANQVTLEAKIQLPTALPQNSQLIRKKAKSIEKLARIDPRRSQTHSNLRRKLKKGPETENSQYRAPSLKKSKTSKFLPKTHPYAYNPPGIHRTDTRSSFKRHKNSKNRSLRSLSKSRLSSLPNPPKGLNRAITRQSTLPNTSTTAPTAKTSSGFFSNRKSSKKASGGGLRKYIEIQRLSTSTGYWLNNSAVSSAAKSHKPSKKQFKQLLEQKTRKSKNFNNLTEELTGTAIDDQTEMLANDLNQVDNLERWVYQNKEVMKNEMIKMQDPRTNGEFAVKADSGARKGGLKMPDLNLDVLNYATKKEKMFLQVARKERLRKDRFGIGAQLRSEMEGLFLKFEKLKTDEDLPTARKGSQGIHDSVKNFALLMDSKAEKDRSSHHHPNMRLAALAATPGSLDEARRISTNCKILYKLIILKLERDGVKLEITEENKPKITNQVTSIAKNIVLHFNSLKELDPTSVGFNFEDFMMHYEQSKRIKENERTLASHMEDHQRQYDREKEYIENSEKESLFYGKFFMYKGQVEEKEYGLDELRKENIKRAHWIKLQNLKVKVVENWKNLNFEKF